jgi:hypothetical protein
MVVVMRDGLLGHEAAGVEPVVGVADVERNRHLGLGPEVPDRVEHQVDQRELSADPCRGHVARDNGNGRLADLAAQLLDHRR